MADLNVTGLGGVGSNLGNALSNLLTSGDIEIGSGPSYQLCKEIYLYHPLGAKIAEKPIEIAQSQKREVAVTGAGTASDKVKDRFNQLWQERDCENIAFQAASLARVYGASVLGLLEQGVSNAKPIEFATLHKRAISFNVYDPLNVSGSLVLNLDPLSPSFLHVMNVAVNGDAFHRSRTCVSFNENPIYLSYTSSAYGYVGRSVYQRALLPLKSFVQTMVTDDMISLKAGVIVAKIKQAGSIVNQRMRQFLGLKRNVVKEAKVGNVISISTEEEIETLNFQNLDGPFGLARKNILENIASAVPMPAKMLTEESFASSLSEGTEDAKSQSRYIDRIREKLNPTYAWLDKIIMRLAWTPDWYYTLQGEFPEEFGDVSYEDFFWRCSNSFKAQWPSLLKEPESEQVKVEDIKLKAIISWVEVLLPNIPPDQRAEAIKWANDQFNNLPLLFGSRLDLDYEEIAAFDSAPKEQDVVEDFGRKDALDKFSDSLIKYLQDREDKRLRLVKK